MIFLFLLSVALLCGVLYSYYRYTMEIRQIERLEMRREKWGGR